MRNNKTAWKYWNCKPTGKIKMKKKIKKVKKN